METLSNKIIKLHKNKIVIVEYSRSQEFLKMAYTEMGRRKITIKLGENSMAVSIRNENTDFEYKGEKDKSGNFRKMIFALTEDNDENIELIGLGDNDGSITLSKSGWRFFIFYLSHRI